MSHSRLRAAATGQRWPVHGRRISWLALALLLALGAALGVRWLFWPALLLGVALAMSIVRAVRGQPVQPPWSLTHFRTELRQWSRVHRRPLPGEDLLWAARRSPPCRPAPAP